MYEKNVLNIFVILLLGITLTGFKESNVANTRLFSIGRSKGADEFIYSLNTDVNNKLNLHDPIQLFWLKQTENHKHELLMWIQ